MNTNDSQVIEIIQQLAEWHKKRVENVRLIIDTVDAEINLDGLGILAADSEQAKWLRIGAHVALDQFEPFPVTISQSADDEDCDDDE